MRVSDSECEAIREVHLLTQCIAAAASQASEGPPHRYEGHTALHAVQPYTTIEYNVTSGASKLP